MGALGFVAWYAGRQPAWPAGRPARCSATGRRPSRPRPPGSPPSALRHGKWRQHSASNVAAHRGNPRLPAPVHPAGRAAAVERETGVNLVDFCGQTIRADGIIINSHQESQKYYFVTVGTDCRFTMQAASPKDKVQFQFRFFLVYSLLRESSILQPTTAPPLLQRNATGPLSLLNTSRPRQRAALPLIGEEIVDTCNAGSYVQFYDGKDRTSPPIGSLLCGKTIPKPILSTGNYLSLRLVTRGQQPRVDFVGHFTSYRPGLKSSECSGEAYFQCQNGKCIPMSLVCDSESIDNCGDGSDESAFFSENCKDSSSILPTPNETSTSTMEHNNSPSPSISLSTFCQTPRRHHHLLSNSIPYPDPAADNKSYVSLLTLYIILGVIAGIVLLFWCCWSPGWLVWRLSVCRFLPCCNSFCAACQLCTHSCCRMDKNRLAKVTPQNAVPIPV
ncbi:low-density lipoprotein receptor class A domain-containing protein 2 [Pristis pectinata]|uniref:low-density lipoprotein receptor class A domain-containing protein 2 n=1 Tax=Pristis pectinata TaxID=685728 RepID=UPI00223E8B7A|nr:low-density lipoprotein receptor class A domain-containing protein 2 [Pristis pectinata]